MKKSVKPYLFNILDTLEAIANNTAAEREQFMNDPNMRDASLMRLQDIGEQLIYIRDKFPDLYVANQAESWHKFIGLRNIISHGYRDIDFETIWNILQEQLPEFAKHIREISKDISS